MRKLIFLGFITVDGVIQAPAGLGRRIAADFPTVDGRLAIFDTVPSRRRAKHQLRA